ncbi:YncE family protein [Stieleria neptunia]|uniref:hypothetical protein n=1 Tax=Stieleria neptunia TaxID=2527979 RepID=UPI001E2F0348|nr:hypothetical protein [Stieleria neptunia]
MKSKHVSLVTRAVLEDGTVKEKPALSIPVRDGRISGSITPVQAQSDSKGESEDRVIPVDFVGRVIAWTASPNGDGAYIVREGNTSKELVFWNPNDQRVGDRIQVPRSPADVVVFGKNIAVLCPESKVVAIVDPESHRIVNAAPIKVNRGVPVALSLAVMSENLYVLCSPNGAAPDRNTVLLELDVESRTTKTVSTQDSERMVVMGDYVASQRNFGGSPSGIPTISQMQGGRSIAKFEHETVGPIYPTPKKHFVAAKVENKTAAFTPANDETLWTIDGTIIAAWHDGTKFLMTRGNDLSNPEALPLIAVDQNGQVLWKKEVPLGQPVSMFLTKNIHLHDRPAKLLVGTANHGSVLTVAGRIAGAAVSRACVIGDGSNDYLLYCISTYGANIRGRFALMVDEVESDWYCVPLPKSAPNKIAKDGSTTKPLSPPEKIKQGETLAFDPKLPKAEGKYELKNGPQGMKVDPKTGKIQWKTDVSSLGQWDVEIAHQHDGKTASVLKFVITVEF